MNYVPSSKPSQTKPSQTEPSQPKPLSICIVAGEESGDALGASLADTLRANGGEAIKLAGVGGRAMAAVGILSPFAIDDLSIIGFTAIPRRLPMILRRIRETADAIIATRPDALVIVDSPDFTHRVARRVRAGAPAIPIIDYVSPSVWAWRPGRARAMRSYIDCVLAILPFEPATHVRLGGPPCIYVGHPLIERLAEPHAFQEKPHVEKPDLDRRVHGVGGHAARTGGACRPPAAKARACASAAREAAHSPRSAVATATPANASTLSGTTSAAHR